MGKRYIKLYEQIMGWEWYRSTNTFRVFVHLLLKANFADLQFEGRTIHRGQVVTSLSSLVRETGLTTKEVRVALEHLIRTGEVASQSFNRFRIITISKYDYFQGTAIETASKGQAKGKQTASKGQQDKNTIESIELEEDYNNPPTGGQEPVVDPFEVFWSAYPRHDGKVAAKKAFDKLKPDDRLMDKIIAAIQKQKGSWQWQKDGGQFIPYPATWLNGKRWEDEVVVGNDPVIRSKYPDHKQTAVDIHGYSQRDYSSEQARAIDRMMNDTWGDD